MYFMGSHFDLVFFLQILTCFLPPNSPNPNPEVQPPPPPLYATILSWTFMILLYSGLPDGDLNGGRPIVGERPVTADPATVGPVDLLPQ